MPTDLSGLFLALPVTTELDDLTDVCADGRYGKSEKARFWNSFVTYRKVTRNRLGSYLKRGKPSLATVRAVQLNKMRNLNIAGVQDPSCS